MLENTRTRSAYNDLGHHYVRKYPYTLSIHALELFNVTRLDIIYDS